MTASRLKIESIFVCVFLCFCLSFLFLWQDVLHSSTKYTDFCDLTGPDVKSYQPDKWKAPVCNNKKNKFTCVSFQQQGNSRYELRQKRVFKKFLISKLN